MPSVNVEQRQNRSAAVTFEVFVVRTSRLAVMHAPRVVLSIRRIVRKRLIAIVTIIFLSHDIFVLLALKLKANVSHKLNNSQRYKAKFSIFCHS